jgi:hypothetical protein
MAWAEALGRRVINGKCSRDFLYTRRDEREDATTDGGATRSARDISHRSFSERSGCDVARSLALDLDRESIWVIHCPRD